MGEVIPAVEEAAACLPPDRPPVLTDRIAGCAAISSSVHLAEPALAACWTTMAAQIRFGKRSGVRVARPERARQMANSNGTRRREPDPTTLPHRVAMVDRVTRSARRLADFATWCWASRTDQGRHHRPVSMRRTGARPSWTHSAPSGPMVGINLVPPASAHCRARESRRPPPCTA
jgi:hypothetical protein